MDREQKLAAASVITQTFKDLLGSFSAFQILDDSDDEFEETAQFLITNSIEEPSNRIKHYVEEIIPNYTEKQFQSHFRITWSAFDALEAAVGPDLQTTRRSCMDISVRKQLLAVIWLLATPDSFRSVSERFDLPKSSLSNCFMRVVKILNKISYKIIKWPSVEEKAIAAREFEKFGGLQKVVGAVDGAFVEIKAPKEHPKTYICRKCFYAMTLQVIAVPSLKIIDAFGGYPGSVGDARVFKNSNIFKNICDDKTKYFDRGEYVLGDKAYPVLTWCIPPYIDRGRLTQRETRFNHLHAKTRQVVERTFALLFGRFRRLKYLDMNVTKMMPATILAACVLHNICLDYKDLDDFNEAAIAEGLAFMAVQRDRLGQNIEQEENVARVFNLDMESARGSRLRDHISRRLD